MKTKNLRKLVFVFSFALGLTLSAAYMVAGPTIGVAYVFPATKHVGQMPTVIYASVRH
jgi:hypothetical protein